MPELRMRESPSQFTLLFGTSGRYGPYDLVEGTLVGHPQAPYTLHVSADGTAFSLRSPTETNQVYGPFPTADRTVFHLGQAALTLVRIVPELQITIQHPHQVGQQPKIGIAPYTVDLVKALYGVREKYAALANRVAYDTADVELMGVPRIHSGITGNTFTPVVKHSSRDKQHALSSADRSAATFLEPLFNRAFTIRSQAITTGSTYHFCMPPGEYLLCAMQKIRDLDASGPASSLTAIWWTRFRFDGERNLALTLTDENAISWRDVFGL